MQSRNYWPTGDMIRVLAILGVMFVHITENALRASTQLDIQWWSLNIAQSFVIWTVPGYIMLSGALLLQPQATEESSLIFYRKRLSRIAIPFCFWVSVYIVFEKWNSSQSFAYQGKKFLHGDVSAHLYFLFVIAGLYAITPGLQYWLNRVSPDAKLVLCILLLTLSTTSILLDESLLPLLDLNALTRWMPYLSYYIVGHYIFYYSLDQMVFFMVLSAIGLLVSIVGKYLEILWSPDGIIYFYSTNYFSLAIIPLAIGIFGLICCLTQSLSKDSQFIKICRFWAPITFGIYLVHPMIFRAVHKLFNLPFPTHIGTALLHEIGVGLVSVLLVCGIGLIPYLRSVVGYNTQKSFAKDSLKL